MNLKKIQIEWTILFVITNKPTGMKDHEKQRSDL